MEWKIIIFICLLSMFWKYNQNDNKFMKVTPPVIIFTILFIALFKLGYLQTILLRITILIEKFL